VSKFRPQRLLAFLRCRARCSFGVCICGCPFGMHPLLSKDRIQPSVACGLTLLLVRQRCKRFRSHLGFTFLIERSPTVSSYLPLDRASDRHFLPSQHMQRSQRQQRESHHFSVTFQAGSLSFDERFAPDCITRRRDSCGIASFALHDRQGITTRAVILTCDAFVSQRPHMVSVEGHTVVSKITLQ
jgi:hypothetical protein